MKFQCCVILKKEPYHVLCVGESDALEIVEREKENVVLVLFSKEGLHRKFFESKASLVTVPQKQLQTRELNEINAIPDDVVAETRAEIDKAIDANL